MTTTTMTSTGKARADYTQEAALRRTARLAGVLYLVIFLAGIFAEFFVRSSLMVAGDAAQTASNLVAGEGLFRAGIAADLVMILADVAIGILFYVLLRPVSRGLALMAAFFRLAQAATLGMNLLNLLLAQQFAGGAGYLSAFSAEQQQAFSLLFLEAHGTGYAIGLGFFAASLLILGYLVYKSGYMPRLLGALLVIAAAGYFLDTFARILLPDYAAYGMIFDTAVFLPAFVAELVMMLWLLVKGVSPRRPAAESTVGTAPVNAAAG